MIKSRYLIYRYFLFTYFVSLLFSPQATLGQEPPYPPSPVIESVTWDFANLVRLAPGSDLWPTTWAADGNIYTSWGDGGGFGGTNRDGRVSLGFARIEGSPPNFTTANVWGGRNPENTATFRGKSAGMLSVGGMLYAWINIQDGFPFSMQLAWSSDLGATWQKVPWTFPGVDGGFAPVTFLNFGKDYAGARDGFLYSYGFTWGSSVNGLDLARVPKAQIKDRATYEFFAGPDASGNPTWTSDVTQRQPVFTDPNGGGTGGSVIFNPGINRYVLTIDHGTVGELGIFDAPEPWGPWTTVAYERNWGGFGSSFALFYAIPTKWISADGKTIYVIFSSTGVLDSFNLVKATLTLKMPTDTSPSGAPTGIKLN